MLFIVGVIVVFGSVLGGYLPHGDIHVLIQPFEILIIIGAALGGFIIGNPASVQKGCARSMGTLLKGAPHSKAAYLELLTLLYAVFKLAKSKGMLALESHIEHPHESELFRRYPIFLRNHHAVDFLCDYLRLMTLGAENPSEIEDLMNEELDTHHAEGGAIAGAITTLGESMPAFGIVAAVLGVIVTMGSINEPPEVLGRLIGAALAGTFMGILFSYGLVNPMGAKLSAYFEADAKYLVCMKAGLLSFMHGHAPAVAVEFGRKTLLSHERPSFVEVEDAVSSMPALPA